MRQTEIGLEIFGPTLAGAKSFSQCAIRFCRRISRNQQRRQLWHRAHPDGQLAARLETDLRNCRAGFAVHLAAFSHVVCVARDSGLRLRGESVGLDAAASRRASLRSCRPTDADRCRAEFWTTWIGNLPAIRSPARASRRTVRSARLCHAHRMVAAGVQSSAELCCSWLLRPPELVVEPLRRRLGRHDGLADSDSSPLDSFR